MDQKPSKPRDESPTGSSRSQKAHNGNGGKPRDSHATNSGHVPNSTGHVSHSTAQPSRKRPSRCISTSEAKVTPEHDSTLGMLIKIIPPSATSTSSRAAAKITLTAALESNVNILTKSPGSAPLKLASFTFPRRNFPNLQGVCLPMPDVVRLATDGKKVNPYKVTCSLEYPFELLPPPGGDVDETGVGKEYITFDYHYQGLMKDGLQLYGRNRTIVDHTYREVKMDSVKFDFMLEPDTGWIYFLPVHEA